MKKQKTQIEYSTCIQELDVPFNAKAFMVFCELKEVYNEKAFFVLLHDLYIQEAKNYNAKYNLAKAKEKELLSLYVYDQVFEYTTAWTYKDVLAWFRKHGFPRKSPTVESEYENLPNIYRARFVLRGLEVEESALLLLLVMRVREAEIEDAKEELERQKIGMYIFSGIMLIVSIVTAPFSGGASVIATVSSIVSIVSSVITLGVTIYQDISMKNAEKERLDTQQRTTELMLKTLPKHSSFADQSITDPYAMYANGSLYKQGGAGEEKFDSMLGYQPYRALIENKFNQSDVYEMLSNDRENMAGMNQYFPHLYPDGKWTSKQTIKELLNGNLKTYLPMRIKIAQAIMRYLTRKGYNIFYLRDKKLNKSILDSKERWSNRWGFIRIQDNKEAYGFTDIRIAYPSSDDINSYQSNIPKYHYSINIYTSWDKGQDGKTDIKWHAVTSHSYVTLRGVETKILKGNQIQLRKSPEFFDYVDLWTYTDVGVYDDGYGNNAQDYGYFFSSAINHLPFAFDSNLYYECEYEAWLYGDKEVHIYKSIKKILNYEAVQEFNKEKESTKLLGSVLDSLLDTKDSILDKETQEEMAYIYDAPITFTKPQVVTSTALVHRIRGEHKFNLILQGGVQDPPARDMLDFYHEEFCQDPYPEIFPKSFRGSLDGLNNTQIQRIIGNEKRMFAFSFGITLQPIYKALASPTDETSKFAERVWWYSRLAATNYQPSEPKKVTMIYNEGTEYFSLSPFINPKARITAL